MAFRRYGFKEPRCSENATAQKGCLGVIVAAYALTKLRTARRVQKWASIGQLSYH